MWNPSRGICLDPWYWGGMTDVLMQTLEFNGKKYFLRKHGYPARVHAQVKIETAQLPGSWIKNIKVEPEENRSQIKDKQAILVVEF